MRRYNKRRKARRAVARTRRRSFLLRDESGGFPAAARHHLSVLQLSRLLPRRYSLQQTQPDGSATASDAPRPDAGCTFRRADLLAVPNAKPESPARRVRLRTEL